MPGQAGVPGSEEGGSRLFKMLVMPLFHFHELC